MVNAPVLEAKHVSMAFEAGTPREVVAFRDISFTLRQGEILAIVGPSGCGKSTLFNVIAGLLRPTSGSVSVDGALVDGARGHIGYMLQKDLLLPWRSVLDNVTLGLEVRGTQPGEARERAMTLPGQISLLQAQAVERVHSEWFQTQRSACSPQRIEYGWRIVYWRVHLPAQFACERDADQQTVFARNRPALMRQPRFGEISCGAGGEDFASLRPSQ